MIHINLLPESKRWIELCLKITCILFFLTLCFQLSLAWANEHIKDHNGNPIGQNLRILSEEELLDWPGELETIKTELTNLDGKISRLTEGALTRQLNLLRLITEHFPEKIWLTKIEVQDKGELLVQGESMDYREIMCWIDTLKVMKEIRHVNLLSFEGKDILQFSIALEIVGGTG